MKTHSQPFYALLCLGLSLASVVAAVAAEPSEDVLQAILMYQRDTGGWPKNINYTKAINQTELEQAKGKTDTTFDNKATTKEMRILAKAYLQTGNQKYRNAFMKGLEFCLKAQYENGGWPQFYPDTTGYHGLITFNDGAMINVMELLQDVARDDDYSFVDQKWREPSQEAVNRGITCILKCQIHVDGQPTVWCAQHDQETFQPEKARSYELPSFSGSESVGIVRFLMEIESPSPEIIQSIEGAVDWFQKYQINGQRIIKQKDPDSPKGYNKILVADPSAPPLWARFYDLKETRPIFCSRDGIPKRSIAEISYERRNGYSWYGPYAQSLLEKDYPKWKNRVQ